MKRLLLSLLFLSPGVLHAQATAQPQAELVRQVDGSWNVEWLGLTGRSYFVEASDDLVSWNFAPLIEAGNDEVIGYETGSLSDRHFVRLVHTDQTAEDLDTADFDGDGLGNLEEITTHHTHPLRADSDSDGLPDGWEIGHGLDPNDDGSVNPVNGGFGDPDGDGSNNLNELAGGNDPQSAADFPPQLISVTREASGNSLVPSSGVPGTASWFCNWTGDSDNGNLSGSLTASTLSGGLSSRYEFPDEPPSDPQFFVASNFESAYFSLIGTYTTYSNNGFTTARGNQVEAKVWLKSPATVEARSFKMVKVTRRLSLPLNTTGGPAAPEESSITAVDVETFNIGGSEELSEGKEVLPQVPSTPGTREKVVVSLLNIEIKPDDNMAGVIGDMVPSSLGAAGEKHFVTPKATAELPQEYVMFKATGVTAEQISPGEGQVVEWVGGEAVPDQPLKRQVKRLLAGPAIPVKIMTKPKEGEAKEQAKVNVWVVWSTISNTFPLISIKTTQISSPPGLEIAGRGEFLCAITPIELITNGDRPGLQGGSVTHPVGENSCGGSLGNGVEAKWDISRRIRRKCTGVIGAVIPCNDGDLATYPVSPIEGNDDNSIGDESNNPYTDITHKLSSSDTPSRTWPNSLGEDDHRIEYRLHFQEFSRLEINGKWFRTSDYFPWRAHLKFHKTGGIWVNDASVAELNNNGF